MEYNQIIIFGRLKCIRLLLNNRQFRHESCLKYEICVRRIVPPRHEQVVSVN